MLGAVGVGVYYAWREMRERNSARLSSHKSAGGI